MFAKSLICLSYLISCVTAVDLTVTLSNGNQYRGVIDTNVPAQHLYVGIPYAAAPTGSLRWMPPQPAPTQLQQYLPSQLPGNLQDVPNCVGFSWNGTQYNEDCLYINIWAPANASTYNPLPVYAFIPGGGLSATSIQTGSWLVNASQQNMLYVTFGYRVGVFGFLASTDIQEHGVLNAGYQDQRFALEWIQENIAFFGGDPNKVTIGGQSAGGGSVMAQIIAQNNSPHMYNSTLKSSQLFHAAVAESPSFGAVSHVSHDFTDLSNSQYQYDLLLATTGCIRIDAKARFQCLQNVPLRDMARLTTLLFSELPLPGQILPPAFPFGPVLDGTFMSELPVAAFAAGNFTNIPIMMGNPSKDGYLFYSGGLSSNISYFNNVLSSNYPSLTANEISKISQLYTAGNYGNSFDATDAYGDLRYVCPTFQVANAMKSNGESSVYLFHYNITTGQKTFSSHSDDLLGFYNYHPSQATKYPGLSQQFTAMQMYLASFVISAGDPNALTFWGYPPSREWEKWELNYQGAGDRLLIGNNGLSMETVSKQLYDRCAFDAQIAMQVMQ